MLRQQARELLHDSPSDSITSTDAFTLVLKQNGHVVVRQEPHATLYLGYPSLRYTSCVAVLESSGDTEHDEAVLDMMRRLITRTKKPLLVALAAAATDLTLLERTMKSQFAC